MSRYQHLSATTRRAKGRPGLISFGTRDQREEMQNAKDSAQDLSKLSIEDNFGHRFFIAPHRHTKTLYLVRHGEGYHNLAGEPALGGSRENYRSEKYADAHLTPRGWAQCRALKKHLDSAVTHDGREHVMDRIELVVVSPLMRALETAVGSLGGSDMPVDPTPSRRDCALMMSRSAIEGVRPAHAAIKTRNEGINAQPGRTDLKFLACELCREHIGMNPCDRRRTTAEYKDAFPAIDFAEVVDDEDKLWGTMNESNDEMCERAHRFMEWIMRRPETHIAVVTHSAFMAAMLREFGATDQLGCHERVKQETHRWPDNCEMRPVVVVDPSGGGGLDPMFFPGGKTGLGDFDDSTNV